MNRYWAYLDNTGVIRIKPYISDKQLQNCEQMPFCIGIFDPFYAVNKEHAKIKIMEFLDAQQLYEKKRENK